ncbi:branched-chain amino acid ABC transporter permease [Viridibacillus sp. FSL R5-0477]|uniref:Branched-chain amino acid ABC transporter permease n=1 Tax=Viridibacillus arenosi FSL R5-213 TaxID=1227360 RepID=W4EMH9_9BACL|nr:MULTISPECIES: branched-chain amino acid ABC transporter permease [Viridibacillus]ETT80961.1 branched-chain amino acid ABC transporter permease [Viridibacillus arenosi FSL R5-213]OMC83923.1 branched-chain amino acid ABC transporter permease [Viridibacillus sp. FSL H8-0123]OMC88444.1 branched-chain amino acid ABC transporter permease [Viridibacillus sp. FSL H7-0596]OMC93082.1 branched-chain amino acid ABC transporter permease [Viridibacillus arenosi]
MDLFISLFINGLATGMLIFLLAAGLTLIFGLMDVLNFAHGGLFVWGAYSGIFVYTWSGSFIVGILGAIVTGFVLGWITEKLIITPVYGNHVQQILITLGFMLVLSECIKVVFGPNSIPVDVPSYLAGSWEIGEVIVIKYRIFIIVIGLIIFGIFQYVLKKTKIGLIVRAGVMDKEMVQVLGINIKRVFLFVFMTGSAMAAFGGMLMAPYSGVIYAEMGMEYAILGFIVVVIGGMGSFSGSLMAAILVGLAGSFMAYYVPYLSLAVNMILMAIVLIFRPQGLFTNAKEG